jgi:hypothetical protein
MTPTQKISLNSRVVVELVESSGQSERREFRLVASDQADLSNGLLDEASLLGRMLLGHHTGERLPYPAGGLVEVRILEVEQEQGELSSDAAERRRESVRKAAAQSEIINQMIFATASGSKWGDYDVNVDKLLEEHQPEEKPLLKDFSPIHFIDQPIEVHFEVEPAYHKKPHCPDGFTWDGAEYCITQIILEWTDFSRRGRMKGNMRLAHAAVAAEHGSLGVGRFFFRVKVQDGRVFDLYYDRAIKNVDDRLGSWHLYREMKYK